MSTVRGTAVKGGSSGEKMTETIVLPDPEKLTDQERWQIMISHKNDDYLSNRYCVKCDKLTWWLRERRGYRLTYKVRCLNCLSAVQNSTASES